MLADALTRLSAVSPKVVAIDLTLTDAGDPGDDDRLEAAMSRTRNLVLASEMLPNGEGWQDPLPRFRKWAAAVGHVHAAQGVNRQVPLEKVARRERRWALALEAFRLSRGAGQIVESPQDLQVGAVVIPARRADARAMFVRRLPSGPEEGSTAIPRVSIQQLQEDPRAAERLRDKVVFVGVTAQSAARDRLMTPYSSERPMPGVEIHANAFETLAQGRFPTSASNLEVVEVCAGDGGPGRRDLRVPLGLAGLRAGRRFCWPRPTSCPTSSSRMTSCFRPRRRFRRRGSRWPARRAISTSSCGASCGAPRRKNRATSRRCISSRTRCGRR